MRFKDKVALITGAGSGIGRVTALLFGKEGASVAIVDRDAEGGMATRELIANSGGESIFIHTDVTISKDVKSMLKTTIDQFGKLNILVNNAGVELRQTIVETAEEEWRGIIENNLTSVFLVSKYAIPWLQKAGSGTIVNIASTTGMVGVKFLGAYGVSKAGVISLTQVLAVECSPDIRVNCICAGAIETPMYKRLLAASDKPEKALKKIIAGYPLGRLGLPEDIARAVVYLASNESSFMTGSTLIVDGGYTAQ